MIRCHDQMLVNHPLVSVGRSTQMYVAAGPPAHLPAPPGPPKPTPRSNRSHALDCCQCSHIRQQIAARLKCRSCSSPRIIAFTRSSHDSDRTIIIRSVIMESVNGIFIYLRIRRDTWASICIDRHFTFLPPAKCRVAMSTGIELGQDQNLP